MRADLLNGVGVLALASSLSSVDSHCPFMVTICVIAILTIGGTISLEVGLWHFHKTRELKIQYHKWPRLAFNCIIGFVVALYSFTLSVSGVSAAQAWSLFGIFTGLLIGVQFLYLAVVRGFTSDWQSKWYEACAFVCTVLFTLLLASTTFIAAVGSAVAAFWQPQPIKVDSTTSAWFIGIPTVLWMLIEIVNAAVSPFSGAKWYIWALSVVKSLFQVVAGILVLTNCITTAMVFGLVGVVAGICYGTLAFVDNVWRSNVAITRSQGEEEGTEMITLPADTASGSLPTMEVTV